MGEEVQAVASARESVAVVWKHVLDALPVGEPPGNGKARWKIQRGNAVFVCEREDGSDEFTARIAWVIDADTMRLMLAPCRTKAFREGDEQLQRALAVVEAALISAGEGIEMLAGMLPKREVSRG